jgi:NAD(P)-dependent dehydrogenase (short-subunit alcohol dehydrogenase family)
MSDAALQRLLITGSSGIAESAARLASQRGARIFLLGNREEQCSALANSLPDTAYALADVTDTSQVEAGVAEAFATMGGIDGVFNVAGLSGRSAGDGPLHTCTSEAWSLMMDVHAKGTFHVCRSVLARWMERSARGAIVNMGSVLARHPQRDYFATHAYAASKGAIEAMTIAAANYYAPFGIRLNVITPGLVRTPMSERAQQNQEILSFIKEKQPLYGDLVPAEDVARAALFLLSNDAAAITGEIVRADGGWAVSG